MSTASELTLNYLKDKYDLDFEQESPIMIRNVGRLDLLRWVRELDFKVGAEIGVAFGKYSYEICELNPQMKLYGVDAWKAYDGYGDYKRTETFQKMYDETHRLMDPYVKRDRYAYVEKFSMDALDDFEDYSLDFVYIDANHQDPFVTQDIYGWAKKVRPGGILAGHDYVRVKRIEWHVKDAIQRYTKEHNIKPWFVLGADDVVPGEVREGSRSWMMVQP